jgi:ubiquinone/menaquinone biosynthesis C-methylase UbiE
MAAGDRERYASHLREIPAEEAALLGRVPLLGTPPLDPMWLRYEMLERFLLLQRGPIAKGMTVLEVGAGAHAIATVPLACRVGPGGQVVAIELSRWSHFQEIVTACGIEARVDAVRADARRLPHPSQRFEVAACLHGVRSFRSERAMGEVFREMLRVGRSLFVAESLPIAHTEAQRAHLAMYELREEVFRALGDGPDDLRYRTLSRLCELIEEAGGEVHSKEVLDVDLPHALAFFPRALIEGIPEPCQRTELLERWDRAHELGQRCGTDHPPVAILRAGPRA